MLNLEYFYLSYYFILIAIYNIKIVIISKLFVLQIINNLTVIKLQGFLIAF